MSRSIRARQPKENLAKSSLFHQLASYSGLSILTRAFRAGRNGSHIYAAFGKKWRSSAACRMGTGERDRSVPGITRSPILVLVLRSIQMIQWRRADLLSGRSLLPAIGYSSFRLFLLRHRTPTQPSPIDGGGLPFAARIPFHWPTTTIKKSSRQLRDRH